MSLYWKCQVGGWSAMVVWSVVGSTVFGTFRWTGVLVAILNSVLGLVATHLFRRVIHRGGWKELSPGALSPRVLVGAVALGTTVGALSLPALLPMVDRETPVIQVLFANSVSATFVMLGWLLIYFCYHFFQRSREAAAMEWELRVAMRDNELRTLRAQLNPHFLFNSLNSLRGLIAESPERAQEAVTALAGLLRHTLRLSALPLVPLSRELEAARNYLALEKIRFEERLTYRIDVAPELLDQAVPPMLLQNLLENALNHGIARRPRGGAVVVRATEGDGRVRLTVGNPGRIARIETNRGLGLANARDQLRLLFAEDARLQLRQVEPEWVECRVVLPRRRADGGEHGPRSLDHEGGSSVAPAGRKAR